MMIEEYECPLLNRTIDMSECYDIQMVKDRFIKEDHLDLKLDRGKAEKLCPTCPFNQLNQRRTTA